MLQSVGVGRADPGVNSDNTGQKEQHRLKCALQDGRGTESLLRWPGTQAVRGLLMFNGPPARAPTPGLLQPHPLSGRTAAVAAKGQWQCGRRDPGWLKSSVGQPPGDTCAVP